jgi:hypothetical protein
LVFLIPGFPLIPEEKYTAHVIDVMQHARGALDRGL